MQRRDFVKQSAAIAASVTILSRSSSAAEAERPVIGHGDYRYRVINDWAKVSPLRYPILNCHEMVQDRDGQLIMVGDHPHNNIMIFDKSGELLSTWGTMFPGGHGLTLVDEGDEQNLLVTDSGWTLDANGKSIRNAGRVTKTTRDGRVIFDIGHPQTIGLYEPGDFFNPTETAVADNGDIYVADGYGKDFIIQYNWKGEYIRHFGGRDNDDPNLNLKNAHGVAIDRRDPNQPLLVCTSRSECCFKYFTLDGQYVKTVALPNMRICRPVVDDTNIYAGVCWSTPKEGGSAWKGHTGFMMILDGDKVVSNPGGTEPEYQDGKLQKSYQTDDCPFMHGHDVCVDDDKNLYVCQWNANHTAPIKLERV
ncbi:twin-arginine translocation signal domain-containing protein [Crateriforma conspicua]|uniref:twin-arginine translocation signal domain-containing protein n=1 Tax=Crateriforma conspicua TaxID=2527996 RepID=UPI00118D4C8A|nr:twin-arginine translocation signal domain-containing protein [Crateriforma conspicua]QDV63160.1 NHL repeat protein [Crateriforma conspicua]